MYSALGVHCFMGAMTYGVAKSFDVKAQLEAFDLGEKTVEHNLKIQFLHAPRFDGANGWKDLSEPFRGVDLVFGNPRCTGFSALGNGCTEDAHGAWARPTIDIRQLFEVFGWLRPAVCCMESVQQFGTVGRDLMEWLVEKYAPGYRVAEVYHNAAQFGNSQWRRRVLFIFYREDLQLPAFEVAEELRVKEHRTVREVLSGLEWDVPAVRFDALSDKGFDYHDVTIEEAERWALRETDSSFLKQPLYNHYYELGDYDDVVPIYQELRPGFSLNDLTDEQCQKVPRLWRARSRGSSFSWHATRRLHPDGACSVIYSGSGKYLHPVHNRSLTVRELAKLMGLPREWTVLGPVPVSQLGKGLCVEAATYAGALCRAALDGRRREKDTGERWERFDLDDPRYGLIHKKPRPDYDKPVEV